MSWGTLTNRQRDVLVLRAAGLGGKAISRLLNISTFTVHQHIHSGLVSLGVKMKVGRRKASMADRNFCRYRSSSTAQESAYNVGAA